MSAGSSTSLELYYVGNMTCAISHFRRVRQGETDDKANTINSIFTNTLSPFYLHFQREKEKGDLDEQNGHLV